MKTNGNNIDISAVEDHDGILTIRGGGARRDWNGIHYKQGMSGKNVGTTSLSANIATIPPGGVAYAHIHVGFEVILYIIEGKVRHEFGPGLKQVIENEAGDFIYIKPGVPHEVFNMSDTEPVVAFVARSSADEWDKIIPYDRNSRAKAEREMSIFETRAHSYLTTPSPTPDVGNVPMRRTTARAATAHAKSTLVKRQSRQHVSGRFFPNAALYRRI